MVAIKEVNENEIGSEASTPVPSPSLVASVLDSGQENNQTLATKVGGRTRPTLVKQKQSIQVFHFPEKSQGSSMAAQHYAQLKHELNPPKDKESLSSKEPTTVTVEVTAVTTVVRAPSDPGPRSKDRPEVRKQVSLNDEIFCQYRTQAKEELKQKLKRQQSLPEEQLPSKKPKTFKESLMAVTQTKQFEIFRDSLNKLKTGNNKQGKQTSESDITEKQLPDTKDMDVKADENVSSSGLKGGLVKIINRLKSEQPEDPSKPTSFTHKKGVTIDPINVFIRRDQSLDSATRRGLFHKKCSWSPKSPKSGTLDTPQEQTNLLSPLSRRYKFSHRLMLFL